MNVNPYARITALLQQGSAAAAEQDCRRLLASQPRDASATHLLALIREQLGDIAEGERLMRASIALQPRSSQFQFNLGHFLRRRARLAEAENAFRQALVLAPDARDARYGLALTLVDLDRFAAAEVECRALVEQDPTHVESWTLLGYILNRGDRLSEAEAAYRRAMTLKPKDALVCHNLGAVVSRLERAEEALELLDRSASLGVSGVELMVNRGQTLALLYRMDEAERSFADAAALNPAHIDAQVNLAKLRYMRGDPDFAGTFMAAASANQRDLRLQASLTTVLRCAGQHQAAETRLRALLDSNGEVPELRSQLAQVLRESGDLVSAEIEARKAATARPHDSIVIDTLISILLSRGRPEDALPLIDAQRVLQPHDQLWIAYEATAARLLERPRYRELYDYSHLVRSYTLEPPPGWSSMAELNAALLNVLGSRHTAAVHPLDQSLRHGSQTMRNLLLESDRAIKSVLQAFEEQLRSYLRDIGRDPSHPFKMRNSGAAKIAGAWSVRLRRDGYHVNHIHPEGWISSAYYVAVPEETTNSNLRSGWLKFGETRYPVPGVTPEHFVQPRAGLLVLFPSYMWHGTNPIIGDEPRTTIAFDAVPADG